MHEVETNLRIVGVNDFSVERRPSLQVREDVATEISEMIRDRLPSCRHYVVIHPGAISPLRCWSSHRFIEVIRWIRESTDLGVVVTGSSSEKALAEEIVSDTRSGVISLAGETSLIQVVAVISGALAMVSVDTGVMHIATAVGTPVIALVGPEDPNRFGPYGRENAVLYHNYSCSPCDQVNCVRGRPECMETITTDEVIGALRRVLVGAGFDYGGS
ncbi:MAG: glycosyltransferase family 9 protein [Candidatus Eisenbacteria bacterium]|nr:glycosyltransferase family 9 protein [Candidatus Eisenbacteria bacterium]